MQRGIGSGIESPVVASAQSLQRQESIGSQVFLERGLIQSEDVVTSLRLVARNYPQQYTMWLDAVREKFL